MSTQSKQQIDPELQKELLDQGLTLEDAALIASELVNPHEILRRAQEEDRE